MTRFSIRLAALAATALIVSWGGAAEAGKVYISGQDSDDSGHVSTAFGAQLLNFVATGATNGGSGILILGGGGGASDSNINAWNAVAGQTLTAVSGAAVATQSLSGFAGILIRSDTNNTSGGISQAELNSINARAADIAAFVNAGGNLMAFTEAGLTNPFAWFPLGSLSINIGSYNPVTQTPDLAAAGFTATNAEISGDLYHNSFTGPAGFFGLKVLATNPANGQAAILGGGATTQIITVPEPASVILLLSGLAGIAAARRRRA